MASTNDNKNKTIPEIVDPILGTIDNAIEGLSLDGAANVLAELRYQIGVRSDGIESDLRRFGR